MDYKSLLGDLRSYPWAQGEISKSPHRASALRGSPGKPGQGASWCGVPAGPAFEFSHIPARTIRVELESEKPHYI